MWIRLGLFLLAVIVGGPAIYRVIRARRDLDQVQPIDRIRKWEGQ